MRIDPLTRTVISVLTFALVLLAFSVHAYAGETVPVEIDGHTYSALESDYDQRIYPGDQWRVPGQDYLSDLACVDRMGNFYAQVPSARGYHFVRADGSTVVAYSRAARMFFSRARTHPLWCAAWIG